MLKIDLSYFDPAQYSLRYKFIRNFKHSLLGDCQLVHEKTSNKNYILKEKESRSQNEYSTILASIASAIILSNNQNLVKLHAYTYKSINQATCHWRFSILYEYLDQDLEKDLSVHQKANEDYKELVLWKVLQDLTEALISLSVHNLIDNIDLKPKNIFLYRDFKDELSYKLFYWIFGLSPLDQIRRGNGYYKFYLSPEEINLLNHKSMDNYNTNDNEKKLIFCLGMMILNIATANATYEPIFRTEKVAFDEKILEIKQEYMFSRYSETFSVLVKRMLLTEPYERPNLQEIILYCKFPPNRQTKTNQGKNNNKLLSNISSDGLSMSFDLCKPEELPTELLENQCLKQTLATGINRKGPLFNKNSSTNNSFELKKNLLDINNKNLDDKLENLRCSFENRMTFLKERISNKANEKLQKPKMKQLELSPHHTAKKSSNFKTIDLDTLSNDQFSTVKKLQPLKQSDYTSDNEWSEKMITPTKKPQELPAFIKDLETTILYSKSGQLKKEFLQIIYPDNSKYIGQTKPPESIRDGIGVYYFSNGDIYLGEWQGNKIKGKGVYYFSEGEYYEGKFIDFKRHGPGIYQYNTGNRYEGEWFKDQKCGFGIFIYLSQKGEVRESYEGNWSEDEKDGEGIYTFANGDKFVGRWQKGKKSGKGMILFADKGIFQGEWVENYANGYGVLKYDNGDIFEGNYENGFKHGGGIYNHCLDDGSKYAGQWFEDERTGNGVYYYSNGDKYTGNVQKGKRSGQGEYVYNNGDVYVGNWLEDKKEGFGQFEFKKGGSYKGLWRENTMDGEGFMMYRNGDNYEGEWKNGLKHGKGVYLWVEGLGFDGKWKLDKMVISEGSFINQEGIRF